MTVERTHTNPPVRRRRSDSLPSTRSTHRPVGYRTSRHVGRGRSPTSLVASRSAILCIRAHRPADRLLDELVPARPPRAAPLRREPRGCWSAPECSAPSRPSSPASPTSRRSSSASGGSPWSTPEPMRWRRRCTAASWSLRRRHHLAGVTIGLAAAAVATVGGYLGGWLAFGEANPRERSTARSQVP